MRKTFWKRLFKRDLKLMVDYNIDPAVVGELNTLGAVKAKTIIDYGFKQDAEDRELIYRGTNHNRCVLLTADNQSIDEHKYPPCGHGGIILIKPKRPSKETIVTLVKAFCQSGHRSKASHNVVHLWADRATIYKHHGEREDVHLRPSYQLKQKKKGRR
jgi:hypothetical protein